MESTDDTGRYLTGQLLIAMPGLTEEPFSRTVIYMCAHSSSGAMGLVVNKPMPQIDFPDLLEQLGIEEGESADHRAVLYGGPVESGRGFVLHSAEFVREGTMVVDDNVALTATLDILRAIAGGDGPRDHLLALGYAGWGPGQLDREIQANGWLNAPADRDLIFDPDLDSKWERALAKLGISPSMLSGDAGHA
ncbi:MAG: YqgE/AlgH family protein [Azospirillaceae bacterium]